MQAACPAPALEELRATFGVRLEVFASPLNCRFPRFCSAAADADEPFGSVGSFFDCDLRSGARCPRAAPTSHRPPTLVRVRVGVRVNADSPWQPSAPLKLNPDPNPGAYLANPPFDPTVVERMIIRMEALLDDADQARMPAHWLSPLPLLLPRPLPLPGPVPPGFHPDSTPPLPHLPSSTSSSPPPYPHPAPTPPPTSPSPPARTHPRPHPRPLPPPPSTLALPRRARPSVSSSSCHGGRCRLVRTSPSGGVSMARRTPPCRWCFPRCIPLTHPTNQPFTIQPVSRPPTPATRPLCLFRRATPTSRWG